MITCENNLFHLQNDHYSCLFRLTGNGLPEHIHLGAPVNTDDARALACKSGLGWGCSVGWDEKDNAACADVLPLAWSGSGRGDYRESPMVLLQEGRPMATDFRYTGHRILPRPLPMTSGLPQAAGNCETLELTLTHGELELRLYWSLFATALTRRAVLENRGSRPVTVCKLMSSTIDLFGQYEMTTFDGGWIAETHRHTVPVGPAGVVNESLTGSSSNRHNPGFLLSAPNATQDWGVVYGFNLVYSGNHYASARRSLQGLTRVMQGINPDHFAQELAPGAVFETPEAVLAWSDEGFNGLSARMHEFVNHHIIPQSWRCRPRPVLFNSWEGCGFDFTHHRLLSLAKQAKKLGCELFVLDDGWFGARDNDTAGLGDYQVNRRKLPKGIDGLARAVNQLGMDFGLWFEPESVNPDSDLYRAHPDWALTDGLPPVLGRHQLLLDLRKPEVRDYLVASVGQVLDSAPISYVKWDMNRHSIALGADAHAFVLGLYDVLRRIFGPRPQILLESCSSGGNRFDLGMLCFSPQIWASDNTDPIERLEIQEGLSYLYPQSTMGAHVSAAPHAQTLRSTPLSTRGNVAFFGVLGYELDLNHLLPVEKKEIMAQIAFYRQHRQTLQFGTFSRLQAEPNATAWQVSGAGDTIVGLFHRLIPAAVGYEQLRPLRLKPKARYRVHSRGQTLRVGQFGALVKHIAPINLNPNGFVLRTADHRYTMKDGTEQYTASGSALMSGLMLEARFTGTGYDPRLRIQGDLGSQVYVIQEN